MSASPGSISPVTRIVSMPCSSSPRETSAAWMAGPPTLSRSMMRTTFMRRRRSCGDDGARLGGDAAQQDLEREQSPQLLPVIARATLVLVDEAAHHRAIEPLPQPRAVGEMIAEVGAQILAEPGAERHAEAHLAARTDRRRQQIGERVLEDALGVGAAPQIAGR